MAKKGSFSKVYDKNGDYVDVEAARFDGTRTFQMQGDVTATQTWNGDPSTPLTLNASIGAKKVTTDKINDKAVGTGQIADGSVGLTQIAATAMTDTVAANNSKLVTSQGVNAAIAAATLNRGKDYGPLSVDEINAISETIPTGSTVYVESLGASDAKVINDGYSDGTMASFSVEVGEDLKYYRAPDNSLHGWYSTEANVKIKQPANYAGGIAVDSAQDASSGTAGLEFIQSYKQNTNGNITDIVKANVQDGTTSQKGVVQLEDSHSSTSTTKAATPKSVKEAYDLANTANTGAVKDVAYDSTNKKITKTINGQTTDVVSAATLKTDMALNNVDNTSDANKPVSTAQQAALDLKLDKTGDGKDVTATFTEASTRANIGTGEKLSVIFGKIKKWFTDLKALAFKDKVGDGDIDGAITDTHISSASTWNGKYDKPSGGIPKSDLSSGVQASLDLADSSVQDVSGKADKVSNATSGNFAGLDSSGNLTDSGNNASDFATSAQGSKADSAIQGVKVNATTLTPGANKVVTVPLATTSADGAMSAADKTKLDGIEAGAEANVQADWDETDSSSDAFVKNKPYFYKATTTSVIYKVCRVAVRTMLSSGHGVGFEFITRLDRCAVSYRVMYKGGWSAYCEKTSGEITGTWLTLHNAVDTNDSNYRIVYVSCSGSTSVRAAPMVNTPSSDVDFSAFGTVVDALPTGYETITPVWVANSASSSGTAPVKVDAYGALTAVPMDSTPTASSTNLMTSGAIKTALDAISTAAGAESEVTAAALDGLDARMQSVEDEVNSDNIGDKIADSIDAQVLKVGGQDVVANIENVAAQSGGGGDLMKTVAGTQTSVLRFMNDTEAVAIWNDAKLAAANAS